MVRAEAILGYTVYDLKNKALSLDAKKASKAEQGQTTTLMQEPLGHRLFDDLFQRNMSLVESILESE